MRKITRNIRHGLTTNSSSNHNIVHNPGIYDYPDKDAGGDYQWNFFTLVSKEAKTRYMMAQLASNLPYDILQAAGYITQEIGFSEAGTALMELDVDHESVIHFPRDTYGSINMDFFQEYKDFLVEGDFAFLGGNDNTNDEHELTRLDDNQETYKNFLNSKDTTAYQNGNYWVLVNPRVKYRICFTDETLAPVKPEIIDIKITDFCDIGCSFCFVEGTKINTPNGLIPINELERGSKVFAFNEKTKELVVNTVDQIHKRNFQGELVIVELENNKILELTPNHKLYTTNRGWVEAGELTEEDDMYGYENM